jgi:hypothetical protein
MAAGRARKRLTTTTPDGYSDALMKLVPPEIVAAFLAIDGIVRGSKGIGASTYWTVYAVLLVICLLWVKRTSDAQGLPVAWRQIGVSTAAFAIWTYAIGGPFEYARLASYNPALAGIVAILFTLAAPLILRRDS